MTARAAGLQAPAGLAHLASLARLSASPGSWWRTPLHAGPEESL